jgi:hypothetical protein
MRPTPALQGNQLRSVHTNKRTDTPHSHVHTDSGLVGRAPSTLLRFTFSVFLSPTREARSQSEPHSNAIWKRKMRKC